MRVLGAGRALRGAARAQRRQAVAAEEQRRQTEAAAQQRRQRERQQQRRTRLTDARRQPESTAVREAAATNPDFMLPASDSSPPQATAAPSPQPPVAGSPALLCNEVLEFPQTAGPECLLAHIQTCITAALRIHEDVDRLLDRMAFLQDLFVGQFRVHS